MYGKPGHCVAVLLCPARRSWSWLLVESLVEAPPQVDPMGLHAPVDELEALSGTLLLSSYYR